jgi:hypothetical protein
MRGSGCNSDMPNRIHKPLQVHNTKQNVICNFIVDLPAGLRGSGGGGGFEGDCIKETIETMSPPEDKHRDHNLVAEFGLCPAYNLLVCPNGCN